MSKSLTLQGPTRIPYIGNLFQLAMSKKHAPYEIFQDLCKTYGSIMFIQVGVTCQGIYVNVAIEMN